MPLVGDVAAGTDVLAQENVEEVMPLPADLTGDGELFMLRVRGDSMIDAGILDGDFVVARSQQHADRATSWWPASPARRPRSRPTGRKGDHVVLLPANPRLAPMSFHADEVTIYGKVVTVLRKL